MKKTIKKGFTLIELMIVIVILGVLMSTVLPRLTGAQARSRDAGRVADLGNIAAALQVYYDDNGQFPAATSDYNNGECLGDDGDSAYDAIKGYLKGNQVPMDPSKGANGTICNGQTPTGRYWYKPLSRSGVSNNGYVLCSDAETFQKANTMLTGATSNPGFTTLLDPSGTSFEAISPQVGPSGETLTADSNPATHSLYCIVN